MEQLPRLLVLYASQTGNAQDVAERIGREAERQHLNTLVMPMNMYHPSKLSTETVVIFVASTTGQGDPPDTMKGFWNHLLRRNLDSRWLDGLKYAVFGLGDSGYVQYNVVAKKLDRRLRDLGGNPIITRGLGDDQNPSGYEAALDPWLDTLWQALGELFHVPLRSAVSSSDLAKLDRPRYRVTYCGSCSKKEPDSLTRYIDYNKARNMLEAADGMSETSRRDDYLAFGPSNPFLARMLRNERLTTNPDERDVRHIVLDLGESGIKYALGDSVAIMPSQDKKFVNAFLRRCCLDPDALVLVEATKVYDGFSDTISRKPVTVGTIVESVLDIASASPRRYMFEVMSHFATSEHEKERLKYFGTPEGRDDLYQYNQRERRIVLEVLEDFPSVHLPFEWLLQLVPRLQPRSFSISSSMLVHPNQVHITVAVVCWRTPYKRVRQGLCSTWLSQLDPNKGEIIVPIWRREGALKLPDPSTPLILIGPGTGCAPFRAFIEERTAVSASQSVAPVLFFFGCRNEVNDFLYKEFWIEQTLDSGVLSDLRGGGFFVAFSRDQPVKVYVQHKIREQSQKVWKMLQSGSSVFIAGSANKMPADVASALEDVVAKEGGVSRDAATKWFKQLTRAGKYYVEAW